MASRVVSSSPWPQRTTPPFPSNPTAFFDSDDSNYYQPPPSDDSTSYDDDEYDNLYHGYRPPYLHGQRPQPSKRQAAPPVATSNDCGLVANNEFTCFPTSDANIVQGVTSRLVWNKNLPLFVQTNLIDVYLFHGDTDAQVEVWFDQQYQEGHLPFTPNDTWWGAKGADIQPGQNQTQTFFFVMVRNGTPALDGVSQTTFTATQTSLPTSILAALASSSSLSASLASLASLSSASVASLSSLSSLSSSIKAASASPSGSSGSLQGDSSNSNNFPNWAIALLSVFGALAFISLLCVLFLLFRGMRRRRMYERASTGGELKYRGSVGSNTPMIPRETTGAEAAFRDGPMAAPSLGGAAAGGAAVGSNAGPGLVPAVAMTGGHPMSDNGSTISHADSAYAAMAGGVPPVSNSQSVLHATHPAPFSPTDAAAMALAFRNVMRKPEFPDVDEGDGDSPGLRDSVVDEDAGREVLESELAEEGRDIRSVSSSRGVKVETVDSSTV